MTETTDASFAPIRHVPPATVVNIRGQRPGDVYIGRGSKWGNPFKIDEASGVGRDQVIAAYREWLYSSPDLIADLPELVGKRLVCYCKPKPCHGDVIVDMMVASGLRDTVAEYRAAVMSVPCSFCHARPSEACTYFPDGGPEWPPRTVPTDPTQRGMLVPMPYVHDDRSATYHRRVFEELHGLYHHATANADLATQQDADSYTATSARGIAAGIRRALETMEEPA